MTSRRGRFRDVTDRPDGGLGADDNIGCQVRMKRSAERLSMKPERFSGIFSMIKVYQVDVRIGNVENGISKLSNTSPHLSQYAKRIEFGLKGAFLEGDFFMRRWHPQLPEVNNQG
jgi:hypothetical protein